MTARRVARMAAKDLYEEGDEKYAQYIEDAFKEHILSMVDDYVKTTENPTVADFSEMLEEFDVLSYDDWATDYIEGQISNYEDQAYSMAKDER